MSLDLFVQRNGGDKRGEDIVDPLIGNIPVALERGRNELDERASGMQIVEITTVFRPGVRLGQLAKFLDAHLGVVWYGKIAGITHAYDADDNGKYTLTTKLQVQRPTIGV